MLGFVDPRPHLPARSAEPPGAKARASAGRGLSDIFGDKERLQMKFTIALPGKQTADGKRRTPDLC